jgi:hypothetical protein
VGASTLLVPPNAAVQRPRAAWRACAQVSRSCNCSLGAGTTSLLRTRRPLGELNSLKLEAKPHAVNVTASAHRMPQDLLVDIGLEVIARERLMSKTVMRTSTPSAVGETATGPA